MSHKVYITSDMAVDEALGEVAEVNAEAALLWPWILTYLDDWARGSAEPRRIKNTTFPAIPTITPETIEVALRLYHQVGLIALYEVDGKRYLAVKPSTWWKYQTHIRTEKRIKDESKFPAPPESAWEVHRVEPEQLRADARTCAQARETAQEDEGEREDAAICIPSPSPSPSLSENIGATQTPAPTALTLIQVEQPAPPPRPARTNKPPSEVKIVLDDYAKRFNEKFGTPPVINWAKDGSLIKKILATLGLERTQTLLQVFFTIQDPFIEQSGYSVGVFHSVINKLIAYAKASGAVNSDRFAGIYQN